MSCLREREVERREPMSNGFPGTNARPTISLHSHLICDSL